MLRRLICLPIILLKTALACANSENTTDLNTVLKFETGTSNLTIETKTKLSDLIQAAKHVGKIEQVQVSIWSVASYKSVLAAERAKNIQDFLSTSFNVANVVVSNLADIAKAPEIMTDSSQSSLGLRETNHSREGRQSNIEARIAKDYGRAAKAVISIKVQPMVRLDQRK